MTIIFTRQNVHTIYNLSHPDYYFLHVKMCTQFIISGIQITTFYTPNLPTIYNLEGHDSWVTSKMFRRIGPTISRPMC